MTYGLENLVTDIRQTLKNSPEGQGSSDICQYVERALGDEAFISTKTVFKISESLETGEPCVIANEVKQSQKW